MNLYENINRIKEVMGINESQDGGDVWYHGSTADISQEDLNPLYRETSTYQSDSDKLKWDSTGSARGGVGIYFGRDKESRCPQCPMQYTGFDSTAAPYTQGFMYRMKLNPNANVKSYSELHNVGKELYNRFREEGVDALVSGNELNVLNPNAIEYFNKIMHWRKVPVLYPLIRGKRGEVIEFGNDGEVKDYLEKELGEYKIHELSDGKKICLSASDPDSGKGYELVMDRKWFKV